MIVTSKGNTESVGKRKIKMNVKMLKKKNLYINLKNVQEALQQENNPKHIRKMDKDYQ